MNLLELFGPVSTFIFETEGVLADEILSMTQSGQKIYNVSGKDTYALHLAVSKGYKVWLVTTGNDEWVKEWRDAGINIINKDAKDHLTSVQSILTSDTDHNGILYMGADIPAYEAMSICGLAVCPANAVPEIKGIAKYISPLKGGQGCVRDVVEKVLKLNGHWQLPV